MVSIRFYQILLISVIFSGANVVVQASDVPPTLSPLFTAMNKSPKIPKRDPGAYDLRGPARRDGWSSSHGTRSLAGPNTTVSQGKAHSLSGQPTGTGQVQSTSEDLKNGKAEGSLAEKMKEKSASSKGKLLPKRDTVFNRRSSAGSSQTQAQTGPLGRRQLGHMDKSMTSGGKEEMPSEAESNTIAGVVVVVGAS